MRNKVEDGRISITELGKILKLSPNTIIKGTDDLEPPIDVIYKGRLGVRIEKGEVSRIRDHLIKRGFRVADTLATQESTTVL